MCDYSLHNVATRPAKVGDRLVTTQFADSITRGFADVGDPNVAVCLLPGTEVAFEKDIEFEGGLGFFLNWKRSRRVGETVARFRQVHMDKPYVHHDALEFPNGEFVLVTRLCRCRRTERRRVPPPRHRGRVRERHRVRGWPRLLLELEALQANR